MSDDLELYRSGSTEPWTVDLLCAYIRAAKPRTILETGTYEARTSIRIIRALYENALSFHFDTVESDLNRCLAARPLLEAENRGGLGRVTQIHGDAIAHLNNEPDDSLDMVFLDDDHNIGHVIDELVLVKHKLRSSGVCFVHDVVGPFNLHYAIHGMGGVVLDLPRLHAGGGLGIVTK